jgi:hypothetical protein
MRIYRELLALVAKGGTLVGKAEVARRALEELAPSLVTKYPNPPERGVVMKSCFVNQQEPTASPFGAPSLQAAGPLQHLQQEILPLHRHEVLPGEIPGGAKSEPSAPVVPANTWV